MSFIDVIGIHIQEEVLSLEKSDEEAKVLVIGGTKIPQEKQSLCVLMILTNSPQLLLYSLPWPYRNGSITEIAHYMASSFQLSPYSLFSTELWSSFLCYSSVDHSSQMVSQAQSLKWP